MSSHSDFLPANGGEAQRRSVSAQSDPLEGLEFLRPTQVAKKLNLSRSGVERLLRQGRLPGIKIGGAWRVHKPSLDRYLSALIQRRHELLRLRAGLGVDDGMPSPAGQAAQFEQNASDHAKLRSLSKT